MLRAPLIWVVLVTAFAASVPRKTHAQSRTDQDRAREHDARVQRLFDEGRYQEALEELRAADRLAPAIPRLYNMALCEDHLGNLESAILLLERFAAGQGVPDEMRERARARAETLRSDLAAVSDPDNGAGTFGQGTVVPPEEGRAEGDETPTEPEEQGFPRRIEPFAFWALAGTTVAASIGTIVVGSLTLQLHDTYEGLAAGDSRNRLVQQDGQAMALATDILLIATIAFAVATATIAFFTRFSRRGETSTPPAFQRADEDTEAIRAPETP